MKTALILTLIILAGLAAALLVTWLFGLVIVWIISWFGPELEVWQGMVIALVISALINQAKS